MKATGELLNTSNMLQLKRRKRPTKTPQDLKLQGQPQISKITESHFSISEDWNFPFTLYFWRKRGYVIIWGCIVSAIIISCLPFQFRAFLGFWRIKGGNRSSGNQFGRMAWIEIHLENLRPRWNVVPILSYFDICKKLRPYFVKIIWTCTLSFL